jgi:hypothetical protein
MPIDKIKKAKREKKHRGTPKGKLTNKKAVAKYDKKTNAVNGTLRINKDLITIFRTYPGKNDDQRMEWVQSKLS